MSIHRTSTLLKINAFSVILLTISNYIFISKGGYNGLAISNLIVIFITFIVFFIYISSKFYKVSFSIFYKPLLSALIMGAIIYILESLNLFLIIFVSMVVYSGGLLLTRTFNKEDYRLIRKIWLNVE